MGFFSKKIEIDHRIKEMVDNLISVAKSLSPKLAEDIKTDLQVFLIKQTVADGSVAKEEVQFINGYLDLGYTVSSMINLYNNNLSLFENYSMPDTIRKLVAVYNDLDDQQHKEWTLTVLNVFLSVMVVLCKGIISIDGDISDDEIDGINEIITLCSDYIEERLGFVPSGVEAARRELVE